MFARRTHQAAVTLAPGETKVYRLPPITPGAIVLDAKVTVLPGPIPIARETSTPSDGIGDVVLHRRVVRTPPPVRPPSRTVDRRSRDAVDDDDAHATVRGRGARVVDHRSPVRGDDAAGRDHVRDHRTPERPQPRIRDHRVDIGLGIDDLDVLDPDVPPPSNPTDLTIELLHGGVVKGTHGHHLLVQSTFPSEGWTIRLTRADRGGAATQRYGIQANYPSILPILERDIAIAAFQRAFDRNWNEHQYITFELREDTFTLRFDEEFAKLYGLKDLTRDIGTLGDWASPNFKSTDIRFTMAAEHHPLPEHIIGAFEVPCATLRVATTRADTWLELKFYLLAVGRGVGFIPKVRLGIPNAPDWIEEEITEAVQEYLDDLPQLPFGAKITPWFVGEPRRELVDLRCTSRERFRVRWVGARPRPDNQPEVLDERPTSSDPPPAPAPYLFDHPDETPAWPPADPVPFPRPRPFTSPGALEAIEHVVVLMLENRSFDQVLGYLSREAGRADVDGLSTDDARHTLYRYPGDYEPFVPHRAERTAWFGFDAPGPGHHYHSVIAQMADGMKGFIGDFLHRTADTRLLRYIMKYFGPEQLPAYAALTEQFAICDRWFTAHCGPTWPNRFITFTGDLNRDINGGPEIDNPDLAHLTPIQRATIFDHLGDRGHSWRLYEHGYSFLRLYGRYTFDTESVVDFRDPVRGFAADARAGRLPRFAFIEPDYVDLPPGNDDHPPADMADGQRLVAAVVAAMLESPQWQNSLLVITYDEHGGFYDHVVPPDGAPLAGDMRKRGPRVPAFVISPRVAAGAVSHTELDHTSIAATVLRRFCSPSPPSLSARVDAAHDLRELIQPVARPRADFEALYQRLVAIRDQPASPRRPPERLKAELAKDDFHGLMRYMATFT